MNVALWIAAGLLTAVLLASSSKMFVPKEKVAGMLGDFSRWAEDFSPAALRGIGVLELLGAVGLVPMAATCVVLLFVGAVTVRLRRGERATIAGDLVYLAMAAFVASGRFGLDSFS
jgi:hypothetical protein